MIQLNLSSLTADEKALLDVMVERGETLFESKIGPEGVTYPEMEAYPQEVGWDKVIRLLTSLTEKGFLVPVCPPRSVLLVGGRRDQNPTAQLYARLHEGINST